MEIPLFPLHTVLAPGIALPLHIFEERYRRMVRDCLDASRPFGVVLIRAGTEVAPRDGSAQELAIAGVGTFAEIREANRYADGRWDVLVVGTGRFLVREVRADAAPYLVADVEAYPDEPPGGDEAATEELAGRVTRRFVAYLRLLQPRDGESVEPIDVQMEVETDEDDEEFAAADDVDEAGDEVDLVDDGDEVDAADEVAEVGGPTGQGRGLPGIFGGALLHETEFGGMQFHESEPEPVPVDDPEATRAALRIPDDPTALSFLLTGIVQVEADRKQALLEATGAVERLRELDALLDRELNLLGARLAPFSVDRQGLAGSAN
jgi:Lon protease-like protein